jgi:hypothetical protein
MSRPIANSFYAELEWAVLYALFDWLDEHRVPSQAIADAVALPVSVTKAILRELINAGLVTYGAAYDDEGMLCGSGYSLSPRTRFAITAKQPAMLERE